ncbi:hypothetical protein CQW23_07200 [Capsicum baccatum]|uniref:Uncharacterized protein n=1 Tax=Capsicum baccatum TaxID=33114 RepID=A0A2G2X5H5_CAPBA|nr:hypothetical protein CQW23_07200 [Capsicum baccatum]
MKFVVKAWSNGKARGGVLQCPQQIETPALLLTTRKGLPVFIPPDHLPSLPSPDSNLLHFSPLHLLPGVHVTHLSVTKQCLEGSRPFKVLCDMRPHMPLVTIRHPSNSKEGLRVSVSEYRLA